MEQKAYQKKTLKELLHTYFSYPMLLLAIYCVCNIKSMLSFYQMFSFRNIIGSIVTILYTFMPLALLVLLWLDRTGKLRKDTAKKIVLPAVSIGFAWRTVNNVRGILYIMDDLNMYTFIRSNMVTVVTDILVAILLLILTVFYLTGKEKIVLYRGIAVLTISYSLFFGIVQQLVGHGSLLEAALTALLVIALYHLPSLLKNARSVELNPKRTKSLGYIVAAVLLVFVLSGISIGFNSGSSSSSRTNTCSSCNRSWPAGDSGGNFMNIARTGMCNNCYDNFNSLKQFLD